MSGLTHLPRIATTISIGTLVAVASTSPAARTKLSQYLPGALALNAPGAVWRLLALVLALLNLKSLTFVWHFRLFRSMIHQLYLQPSPLPADALFRPLVTRAARTSMLECDYNLHKSNSTYFADFDIARSQLLSCLLRKGITSRGAQVRERRDPGEGLYMMALGGVTCHFRREVKAYQKVEMWTRVLAWDRKWIYLVCHMVKAGTVQPAEWALQPWRKGKLSKSKGLANGHANGSAGTDEKREALKKAVFATSISKYVVKKGRITVAPEIVLQRSDLLPPKPEGAPGPSDLASADALDGLVIGLDGPPSENAGTWTWDDIEKERLRGLRMAEKFAALDALHDEFPSAGSHPDLDSVQALGSYADLLW